MQLFKLYGQLNTISHSSLLLPLTPGQLHVSTLQRNTPLQLFSETDPHTASTLLAQNRGVSLQWELCKAAGFSVGNLSQPIYGRWVPVVLVPSVPFKPGNKITPCNKTKN